MVQFYCEHHNLDHGDFCSENYNIAGTPNLNSNSNSNSNLKVAVNLYVFLLLFFSAGGNYKGALDRILQQYVQGFQVPGL